MKKYLTAIFDSKTRDEARETIFQAGTFVESERVNLMIQQLEKSKEKPLLPKKKKTNPFLIPS